MLQLLYYISTFLAFICPMWTTTHIHRAEKYGSRNDNKSKSSTSLHMLSQVQSILQGKRQLKRERERTKFSICTSAYPLDEKRRCVKDFK